MTSATRSVEVGASPAAVWAALADFGSLASWALSVDHACLLTEQHDGVGAARRVQVGRTTVVERLVGWDEGRSMRYVITGLPPLVGAAANTWSLAPTATGTRVSLTCSIDGGRRPLRRLVARLAVARMASACDALLADLAAHLDGQAETRGDERVEDRT